MTYLDCVIKKAFCEEIIAESWMIRAQIFDERTFQTEGTVKYQGPCGSTNLTYGRNKRRSEGWRSTGKGERRMRWGHVSAKGQLLYRPVDKNKRFGILSQGLHWHVPSTIISWGFLFPLFLSYSLRSYSGVYIKFSFLSRHTGELYFSTPPQVGSAIRLVLTNRMWIEVTWVTSRSRSFFVNERPAILSSSVVATEMTCPSSQVVKWQSLC